MEYVIKSLSPESERYIRLNPRGRMTIVTTPEKATRFQDAMKAWNALSQQIAKKQRDGWKVIARDFSPTHYDTETENQETEEYDWRRVDAALTGLYKELSEYRDEVLKKLTVAERELCDVEHAIEFRDFTSTEALEMTQLLHESRVRRRMLKNEFRRINAVLNTAPTDVANGRLTEIFREIENQVYAPRALRELFVRN